MTNLEYLKLQADNLFSDFQTKTIDDEDLFQFTAQYFDADGIVLDFDLDEENLTLQDAQEVIAHICGFEFGGWEDLLKADEDGLEVAKLLFDNQDRVNAEIWHDHLFDFEDMNPDLDIKSFCHPSWLRECLAEGFFDSFNVAGYRLKAESHGKAVNNDLYKAQDIANNIIEFFRLQAKNLHRDYKTKIEHTNEDGAVCYKYKPEYFDVTRIFTDYHVDESNFSLMKAQHVIARMVGFKKWDDLIKGSLDALEIGYILFSKQDTISMRGYLAKIAQDDKNPMGLHYAALLHSLAYYEEGENAEEDYRLRKPEPETQTFFGYSRR